MRKVSKAHKPTSAELREAEHIRTKEALQLFYSNLVKAELTDPKGALKTHYLGVEASKKLQEDVKDLESFVSPFGTDGIFQDGIPFYHYRREILKDEQQQRILTNNCSILRTRFTSAEDRQIRRNFKDYCKLTGHFHPNDAEELFSSPAEDKKGRRLAKDPFFYAFMCRGLLNRTCAQMIRRAYTIFHKAQDEGGCSRPWTQVEDNRLKDLVQKYDQHWEKIGQKMSRPRFHCYHRYHKLVEEEKITEDDLIPKVFYHSLSKQFGYDAFMVSIKDAEIIQAYEKKVNWKKLAEATEWTEDRCREYWNEIKVAVKQSVDEQASTDPKLIKAALPKALRTTAMINSTPHVPMTYSKTEVSDALKLFLKAEEENLTSKFKKVGIKQLFLQSEALSQFDVHQRNLIGRCVYGLIRQCEANNLFDSFPEDKLSFYYKLEAIQYMLEKRFGKNTRKEAEEDEQSEEEDEDRYEHFKSIAAIILDYVTSKGWEPRTRTFLVHKLENGQGDDEEGTGESEDVSWARKPEEASPFKKIGRPLKSSSQKKDNDTDDSEEEDSSSEEDKPAEKKGKKKKKHTEPKELEEDDDTLDGYRYVKRESAYVEQDELSQKLDKIAKKKVKKERLSQSEGEHEVLDHHNHGINGTQKEQVENGETQEELRKRKKKEKKRKQKESQEGFAIEEAIIKREEVEEEDSTQKRKKKKKHRHEDDVEESQVTINGYEEEDSTLKKEKKKKNRHRIEQDEGLEESQTAINGQEEEDSTQKRKKKKRRQSEAQDDAVEDSQVTLNGYEEENSTVKRKKKKKRQREEQENSIEESQITINGYEEEDSTLKQHKKKKRRHEHDGEEDDLNKSLKKDKKKIKSERESEGNDEEDTSKFSQKEGWTSQSKKSKRKSKI